MTLKSAKYQRFAATEVIKEKDLVIGRAGSRDLKGDLYCPPATDQPHPALVIVHGGGWRKGSPNGVRGFGEFLSHAGFVCLCPDYRLSGEAHWPAQIEDIKCAIRFLRSHHENLGLDPARIGITGDSAGGHLALMAAVASEFDGDGGFADEPSDVHAVGAMYGPVRIPEVRADGSQMDLLPIDATAEDYASACPIHYDLSSFPPCLLIHGVDDPAVPIDGTLELHRKLIGLNRTVELHTFAGEGHAFDRRSSKYSTMVDILDATSIIGPTVIQLIAHFFSKYLAP